MYYDIECETCDREFGSQQAATQHMNALDHWAPRYECDTCDREFFTQRSADQHMDDTGHREPEFECETCNRRFYTQQSANQHMDALDHYRRYDCQHCSKTFQSENALKMVSSSCTPRRLSIPSPKSPETLLTIVKHLNSSTHRGKNVACPFCKVAWTSASGLSHHLESGSCPRAQNINHRTIHQAISRRDPSGLVTNKLLTYPDSNIQNIATNATWNGSWYECYLCHREFGTLQALNQHLNSAAHSEKLYHCPNRSCDGQFVRLASLFNHLESESCKFIRFERVQQHVHTIMTGRAKLIGFA
jgi:DNA-directed RNA polymerase subunit RPC12/RpoP